jgi:Serine dehydratase beta chain
MTVKLVAGNDVLLEQEYYSVGGGFIESKASTPPAKKSAQVSLLHDEGIAAARRAK